jgi:hypothetical protein
VAVVGVVSRFWRDWIEVIFGFDPDNHNGSFEWLIVGALLLVAIFLRTCARADWRRIVAARSRGIDVAGSRRGRQGDRTAGRPGRRA